MPTVSFNVTSDATIGFVGLSPTSDAWIGTGFGMTSDAQIAAGFDMTSDSVIGSLGPTPATYSIPYTSDAYVVGPAPEGPGPLPKTGCSFSTPCQDPSIPIGNYTSEAPQASTFTGFSFPVTNPNNPTNGGVTYHAEGCLSVCDSAVSQEEADLCAARQAFICSNTPGPGEPPGPTFYYSGLQQCRMECPNGDPFIYTLAAGAFVDTNQALANARALVYACQQASRNAICLGSLPNGCVGSAYNGTLQRNAGGIPPFRFAVVAGVIPPGLAFNQVDSLTAVVSGTPTTAGTYSFTVQATDTHGNWMNREITVCILGSTLTALPNGSTGSAYNQTLTAPDCATQPLSWQVTSGSLPPGLTLDESTGVISGTPTTSGTYNFSIILQTAAT